jgi:saccharopine dehydrogenase-like NADP-dependent oxidoreductase
MKIVVVGGAGEMGRVAAATAAADPKITSVVIADRDRDQAAKVATEIGAKVSWRSLDITNTPQLLATLADVDMVLNTVGPFYLFGRPVLEAAISTRTHYADIADDWEPTVEMLELDEQARDAGIVAIVGMGASPGLSNLMAAVAHAQLDTVESLHTVWRGGAGVPKAPDNPDDVTPAAAIDHWIHNLAAPIRVWRSGAWEDADALEETNIHYPGLGPGRAWTCGHPEPVTLPRTFPDIKHSANLMFSRPGLIDALRNVRDRVRTGELTVPQGSKALILAPGRRGPEAGPVPAFPEVFAYAEGTKAGKPARVAVTSNVLPEGKMGEVTCIPLAMAAGMVARGEVSKPGVCAPEAVIDPQLMFTRLAPYAGQRAGLPVLDIATEWI